MSRVPPGAILYKLALQEMRGDILSRIRKYAAFINFGGMAGVFNTIVGAYVVRARKTEYPLGATHITAARTPDWIGTISCGVTYEAFGFPPAGIDQPVVFAGGIIAAGVDWDPVYKTDKNANDDKKCSPDQVLSWDTRRVLKSSGSPPPNAFVGRRYAHTTSATSRTTSHNISASSDGITEADWFVSTATMATSVGGDAYCVRTDGGEFVRGFLHGSMEIYLSPSWAIEAFGAGMYTGVTCYTSVASIHKSRPSAASIFRTMLGDKEVVVVSAQLLKFNHTTIAHDAPELNSYSEQPLYASDHISALGIAVYDVTDTESGGTSVTTDCALLTTKKLITEFEGAELAASPVSIPEPEHGEPPPADWSGDAQKLHN